MIINASGGLGRGGVPRRGTLYFCGSFLWGGYRFVPGTSLVGVSLTAALLWRAEVDWRGWAGLTWLTYFNTALFPAIAGIRWARTLLGRANDRSSDFDDRRPGRLNDLLTRIFASERHVVGRVRLPIGVSLLAVSRFARAVGEKA